MSNFWNNHAGNVPGITMTELTDGYELYVIICYYFSHQVVVW